MIHNTDYIMSIMSVMSFCNHPRAIIEIIKIPADKSSIKNLIISFPLIANLWECCNIITTSIYNKNEKTKIENHFRWLRPKVNIKQVDLYARRLR